MGLVVPLSLGLLLPSAALAQREPSGVELWGDYGWQEVGDISFSGGKVELEGSDGFGAGITVPLRSAPVEGAFIQLGYHRTLSHASIRGPLSSGDLFDVAMNHYQFSVIQEKPAGRATPYGAFSLGMLQADPDANVDDLWMFEIGLGLGVKVPMGERLGIRVETNVDFPLSFTEGSIWCGGGGCVGGVSGTSYLIQGGIRGALLLRL